ncbi:MAG: hypothetical protein ACOYI2_05310 [Bacillota bacterium]|nr:hypothetical protein [Clostridia bacterium]
MNGYCPMMMGHHQCNFYPTAMYYPRFALPKSLKLIKEAVAGEREDELFYDYLISVAPTPKGPSRRRRNLKDQEASWKESKEQFLENWVPLRDTARFYTALQQGIR